MVKMLLINRLKEYYKLERFHTIWISVFAVFLNVKYGWKSSLLLSYGIGLMVWVLFQGTYYWKAKLLKLSGQNAADEKRILEVFNTCKIINCIIICFYPVFGLWLYNNALSRQLNTGWAAFAFLFGVAEHVNYYHIQLMYDNQNDWNYLRRHKKLKVAALRRDFNARKSASSRP